MLWVEFHSSLHFQLSSYFISKTQATRSTWMKMGPYLGTCSAEELWSIYWATAELRETVFQGRACCQPWWTWARSWISLGPCVEAWLTSILTCTCDSPAIWLENVCRSRVHSEPHMRASACKHLVIWVWKIVLFTHSFKNRTSVATGQWAINSSVTIQKVIRSQWYFSKPFGSWLWCLSTSQRQKNTS